LARRLYANDRPDLKHAIGIGNAFMLPEMFHPRIQQKGFNEMPVEGGILE
jgi:hypothetical protein